MRLREDSEYELLQCDHVVDSLKNINEFTEKDNVLSTEVLVQKLKQIERKRHIMVWHDCSTISSHSYFMIMVSNSTILLFILQIMNTYRSANAELMYRQLLNNRNCTY